MEQLEEKQSELRREVVGLKEVLNQVTLQKEVLEEETTSLSLALTKVGPLETPIVTLQTLHTHTKQYNYYYQYQRSSVCYL